MTWRIDETGRLILPGDGKTWEGDLILRGRSDLRYLPDGLTVTGELDLRGCTALTDLSGNLTVWRNLYVTSGTVLRNKPDPFTIRGAVYRW